MTMQNTGGNGAGGQNGNGQGGQSNANGNSSTTLTDQQAADALKNQQNNAGNQQGQQQQQQQVIDPKVAELEAAITELSNKNADLMTRLEVLAVESLPEDQKARAKALIQEAKKEATKEIQEQSVMERELNLDRREIAGEYQSFGLTVDALKDAKSKAEMEVIALRTKADFLEKGGRPNSAKIPSDVGGGQGGGGGQGQGTNTDPNRHQPQRGDRAAALIGERFRNLGQNSN